MHLRVTGGSGLPPPGVPRHSEGANSSYRSCPLAPSMPDSAEARKQPSPAHDDLEGDAGSSPDEDTLEESEEPSTEEDDDDDEDDEEAPPDCRQVLNDLMMKKAVATVVGFLVMNSIRLTCANLMLGCSLFLPAHPVLGETIVEIAEHSKTARLSVVSLFFLLWLMHLIATSAVMMQVSKVHSLDGSVGAALAMIPAWAWKDFVNRVVSAKWLTDLPRFFKLLHASWGACLAALASAGLQLLSEWFLQHVAEEGTLLHRIMTTLGASLSLGCGFAVNNIFKSFFGEQWDNLRFQLIYTSLLSCILPVVQSAMRERVYSRLKRPLCSKFIDFLLVAGNFLLSWAWKGLIDAFFHYEDVMEPLIVTPLGTMVTFLASRCNSRRLRERATLVAGMNIGWAWLDWCSSGVFGEPPMTRRRLWMGTLSLLIPLFTIQVIMWHPSIGRFCAERGCGDECDVAGQRELEEEAAVHDEVEAELAAKIQDTNASSGASHRRE